MARPSKPQRNKDLVKKIDSGWTYQQVMDFFGLKSKATIHEIYQRWAPLYSKKRKFGIVDKSTKKVLDKRSG